MRRRTIRVSLLGVLLLCGVPLGFDLAAPPERQVTAAVLIDGIHLYQRTLSPLLSLGGVRCRFEPSCSHYAVGAIERYGALRGSWRAAKRLLRCGPWTPAGTVDPP